MDNYIKINALEVLQLASKTGAVYTGRITFEELLLIHRLTERKESMLDPFGINKTSVIYDDEEFQRHLNNNKLLDLMKFLDYEINESLNSKIIFPSSVIISLDLNENNSDNLTEKEIEGYFTEGLSSCFVTEANGLNSLYIPKTKRICLIVDGQHRFYGLKKYYDKCSDENLREKIRNFQFITSVLLGYDTFQVAEVFANVNFNQKPVNKSLYYDIFGSAAKERNEIQLAHFLALHMNNNSESPLYKMIKLLGKGFGLFSQAFFVEKLLIHFKENGVWEDLYEDYLNDGEAYLKIPTFLKAYFDAIKTNYSDSWPIEVERDGKKVYSAFNYSFILCKTTGMGAFLRLIKDIYPRVKDENYETIYDSCNKIFSKLTLNESSKLFSKEGDYGKGGSEGFQIRLYRHLKDEIYNL